MNPVFSFDAETNGLWGQVFAIGAIALDERGREVAVFAGRCPIESEVDPWVEEHVLPAVEGLPIKHTYAELLQAFSDFYLEFKNGADVIVHMGTPVEARLLIEMHRLGFIGDWDGPFPLIDIAGNLVQVGEDPTSVDAYAEKYRLMAGDFASGTHDPLYDAAVTAAVYRHLIDRR